MINTTLFFIMEIIGTIAFSCSGAMVAIRKKLDFLGVIVLGVITAVGGGMFRDILIGKTPPELFRNPVLCNGGCYCCNLDVLYCAIQNIVSKFYSDKSL